MENLLVKISPFLDSFRGFTENISGYIARAFELDPLNVQLILIGIISIYLGKKIMEVLYSTSEGRGQYLILISGGLFYILKYL